MAAWGGDIRVAVPRRGYWDWGLGQVPVSLRDTRAVSAPEWEVLGVPLSLSSLGLSCGSDQEPGIRQRCDGEAHSGLGWMALIATRGLRLACH